MAVSGDLPRQVSRNFDHKEDEMLMELVSKLGTDAWPEVAAALGTRTARQCRNRYNLFLDPSLNNSPWTPEEDELLKKQYERLGPRWAVLRAYFPGRTDLNIKNRFGFLVRNRADIKELKMKYLSEHGAETLTHPAHKKRKEEHEGRPIGMSTLFESLPYFVKRCSLLEDILRENQVVVPPEGICDEKQWVQLIGEQLIPIPGAETHEKA